MNGDIGNCIPEQVSEDAVFVIGAGHFGSRAANILSSERGPTVIVVDRDRIRLSQLHGLPIERILQDGVLFLVENFHLLHPTNIIIPAVPVNLAYEWLRRYVEGRYLVRRIDMPEGVTPLLPHVWPGSEGSLLVSYADFVCPDDCPEPESCTVTGEPRDKPLYQLLGDLDVDDFRVHIIRSHQIAPGLGGYGVAALNHAMERLTTGETGKWILGTSCRCHGILTSLEIQEAL
jgi:hypothetical protein